MEWSARSSLPRHIRSVQADSPCFEWQIRASTVDFGETTVFPSTARSTEKGLADPTSRQPKKLYGIFRVLPAQRDNPGLLAVLVPTEPVEQAQRALVGILILIGLGLVGAVTLLAYRTAKSITTPLESLAAAAQRIEAGDLAARVRQVSAHETGHSSALSTRWPPRSTTLTGQREYLDVFSP